MDEATKVLHVDDDPFLLTQTNIFLEKEDEELEIVTASSAKKGLELLDETFDVIVSDYKMPVMDGLDFLEVVREEREMDIPFIIFTGKGREEVAIEALNLGADRYLQKGGDLSAQFKVLKDAIVQEWKAYRKEKELKESEKEKSKILEITSDEIAYHDTNHRIMWANRSYLESIGKSLEEIKGKKCYKVWFKRDQPCRGCPTEEALKSGKREKGEISPSETDRYWLITATPYKDEEGNIRGVLESSLDITEIKEKEKKIKKLYEGSTELGNCASEKEIYEQVLKSAEEILDFEACTVLMKDDDYLVVKATKAENVEEGEKYSKDEGIRGLTF